MRIISYVVLMRVARVGVRQSDKKSTQLCLLPRLESCGLFLLQRPYQLRAGRFRASCPAATCRIKRNSWRWRSASGILSASQFEVFHERDSLNRKLCFINFISMTSPYNVELNNGKAIYKP